MADISHEEEKLLLKLYNLKSDESTILTNIRNKKNNIGEMIEDAKDSKERTEREKEELEGKLSEFTSEKDLFFDTFGGLENSRFQALEAVGVTVEIEQLLAALSDKAPEYEDSLRQQIESAKNKIVELFGQISTFGADLESTEEELERAEVDRQALASLVEQSLSGNESDSLSKQYIRSILSNFADFTEDEITELCKVILFPEDALSEFDRTYDERKAKSEAQVEETVAETVEETPVTEEKEEIDTTTVWPVVETEEVAAVESPSDSEEKIDLSSVEEAVDLIDDEPKETSVEEHEEEPKQEEEIKVTPEEVYGNPSQEDGEEKKVDTTQSDLTYSGDAPTTIIDLSELSQALEEDERRNLSDTSEESGETKKEEPVEEVKVVVDTPEEVSIDPSEEIKTFLQDIGLQLDKFENANTDVKEVYNYLKDVDRDLIKNNYELLRSINDEEEAYKYRDGHMFLADSELSEKITFLRSKLISEKKIKEILSVKMVNPSIRKKFEIFKSRAEALERVQGSLTDTNIDYVNLDTETYETNMELMNKTFELDDKEIRNFKYILFSPYVAGDMKVLKEYLISIVKQDNGRYALNAFTNKPLDLMVGIDNIVESGLENLTTSNPEVLGTQIDEVIKRAKYLNNKGESLLEEDSDTYVPALYDAYAFNKLYGSVKLPELRKTEEVNNAIPDLIGNRDFVQILIEALNSYYSNPEVDPEITVDGEERNKYNELMAMFEEQLKATKTGNLTYQVAGVNISRNKLERNIKLLLNILSKQGQDINGVEKEVILTSLLFNLREDEEKLRKVVETCLGFNEEKVVGGPSL